MRSLSRLLLAGGLVLAAPTPGEAGSIEGSRHDLSTVWTNGSTLMKYSFNNYGEVCVYCHTPHNADASIEAPLWNRSLPAGPYTIYTSSTLDSPPGQPSGVSLVCLSCHDGTVAVDAIRNAPGSGPSTSGPWYGRSEAMFHFAMAPTINACGECHAGGAGHNAEASYLSTDLGDDHPIAMVYPTAAQDPDFRQPPGSAGSSREFPNGVKTFPGDRVECPSCHDVHNPDNAPFLRTSNADSALCLTCHVK